MFVLTEWDYTTNLFSDLSYNVSDSRSRIARVSTFAPKVFADLRSRFGISDSAFQLRGYALPSSVWLGSARGEGQWRPIDSHVLTVVFWGGERM